MMKSKPLDNHINIWDYDINKCDQVQTNETKVQRNKTHI